MKLLNTDCTDPTERRKEMEQAFLALYGDAPGIAVRAPGRVDLMGSHTDYNDGFVLTLPINREIWILARPRDDGKIRITSLNMGTTTSFDADDPGAHRVEDWGVYAQGVAVELQQAGYALNGCDALLHGTVPVSSGLSSSAALESAVATLFEELGGYQLDKVEKARLTQRAENAWVGVNCGILDQYSSILGENGKALMLDCRSLTHSYASFPEGLRIIICNTCAPRNLSGSEYDERRAQCEQATEYFSSLDPAIKALRDVSLDFFEQHAANLPVLARNRSRFVIEENARVAAIAQVLDEDDRPALAELTTASFEGARDLFEISVPAMQAMMDAMSAAPGCVGCRQAGAGFGGCMVAMVEKEQVETFCEATAAAYEKATGLVPEIYPISTAPGAGVIEHS